jgi:hypothetical protein
MVIYSLILPKMDNKEKKYDQDEEISTLISDINKYTDTIFDEKESHNPAFKKLEN